MPQHSPAPSPERALQGFVLYLASFLVLSLYLSWAILPDHILNEIGFTYYPQRYWAITIPVFITFSLTLFFTINFILNLINSFELQEVIQDYEYLNNLETNSENDSLAKGEDFSIPAIRELNIPRHSQLTSEVVYSLQLD
ncbi:phosphatidylinositol N-acetylglucosaminyltransferase subunit P-like [Ciona intestinalis]